MSADVSISWGGNNYEIRNTKYPCHGLLIVTPSFTGIRVSILVDPFAKPSRIRCKNENTDRSAEGVAKGPEDTSAPLPLFPTCAFSFRCNFFPAISIYLITSFPVNKLRSAVGISDAGVQPIAYHYRFIIIDAPRESLLNVSEGVLCDPDTRP